MLSRRSETGRENMSNGKSVTIDGALFSIDLLTVCDRVELDRLEVKR